MQGRPGPEDVDVRHASAGASAPTPGMGVLDQAREASLADEGGASGARIESQDLESLRRIASDLPVAHLQPASLDPGVRSATWGLLAAGALAAVGLIGFALYQRSR